MLRRGRYFPAHPGKLFELAPRAAAQIAHDAVHLTLALAQLSVSAKPPAGRFVQVAFDPGRKTPDARSRRAMVITGISLAPNTYVVAVHHETAELVRHQLLDATLPKDRQWPV
jgi:hypothetical protein